MTISRLAILFVDHARQYYRKNGKETSEVHSIRTALRPLVKKYGREKVSLFGPRRLKEVRDEMIGLNWTRTGINAAVRRITRMLRMPGACIVPAISTFLSDFVSNLVELNSQIRLKPLDYGCKRGRHNAVSCDQSVVKPGVKVLGQIPNGTITQQVVRATCVKTGWAESLPDRIREHSSGKVGFIVDCIRITGKHWRRHNINPAGNNNAIRIAIIAMTTRSSIKVNARRV